MIGRLIALLRDLIVAVMWGSILALASRLPPAAPPKAERKRREWKDRLIEGAVLFGVLGVIGVLVVVLGLIPIKASSGHWAITRWFLELSMERAFSTQSAGVKVPPLDDPAMVLRGAGHYEIACRPCHGSPDLVRPRVAAAMTPAPPYLPEEVQKWTPAQLFSIVKHGVKFTGMPAWPARNRDDEVWSVVAFLLEFPGLSAAEYETRALGEKRRRGGPAPIEDLTGPVNVPAAVRERCARCHGVEGEGRGGVAPKLAGQHREYLYNALRAYERGQRPSGIMEPVAAGLTDGEMRELAQYYAGLEPAVGAHGSAPERKAKAPPFFDEASIARGREIAHRGIPEQKVPSCIDCHGPTEPHPRDAYPMLAGQHADYLTIQLELFKKQHRGGSRFAHLMHEVAPKLSSQQIRDLAHYYSSLGE